MTFRDHHTVEVKNYCAGHGKRTGWAAARVPPEAVVVRQRSGASWRPIESSTTPGTSDRRHVVDIVAPSVGSKRRTVRRAWAYGRVAVWARHRSSDERQAPVCVRMCWTFNVRSPDAPTRTVFRASKHGRSAATGFPSLAPEPHRRRVDSWSALMDTGNLWPPNGRPPGNRAVPSPGFRPRRLFADRRFVALHTCRSRRRRHPDVSPVPAAISRSSFTPLS